MKKVISILFILTLLIQAVPVLHFFSEKPEVFYTAIDEEKPESKSDIKEKKADDKSFIFMCSALHSVVSVRLKFEVNTSSIPLSPCLKMLTPPPDAA